MAINLTKPLGTDIYNVGVFNDNSTVIQDIINNLILPDIDNLNKLIEEKFNYAVNDTLNLDNVTGNKIYFITGILTGDVLPAENIPSGGNIVINYDDGNITVETVILSDSRLYQRSSTNNEWVALTSKVVDNLNTEDKDSSLSAKQGKVLNDTKLSLTFLTSEDNIDIDNINTGIYIGTEIGSIDETNVLPDVIGDNLKNFILFSLGNINELCTQLLFVATDDVQGCYIRYGFIATETNTFSFSDWTTLGGADSNLTDIYSSIENLQTRVEALENANNNTVSVELIQI